MFAAFPAYAIKYPESQTVLIFASEPAANRYIKRAGLGEPISRRPLYEDEAQALNTLHVDPSELAARLVINSSKVATQLWRDLDNGPLPSSILFEDHTFEAERDECGCTRIAWGDELRPWNTCPEHRSR